jgi:phenylpropionate dioxygenase-like ring-hydroxylating dioxygenase large terminal subunit
MLQDPLLINDWHVVARASEIAIGQVLPVRLLGSDLVLWRGDEGFHAWQDLCIHRGAQLSGGRVENDCLVCPYHGWTYDEGGDCVKIPAHPQQPIPGRARAATFQVKVAYDLVWVCLGTPDRDVPYIAVWDDSSFRKIAAGPYKFRAHGPRIIENFLDVGHLAFVHAGLLGDPNSPEIADYAVESTADGIIARDIMVWQPDPDGTGRPAQVQYTYETLRPLTASFMKSQGDQRFYIIDIVTPVGERESVAWAVMALNYAEDIPDKTIRDFQDEVTKQDLPIVESQHPELLPLDLQAEMHLRSDRAAIGYRQWLKQLGLKYGTS